MKGTRQLTITIEFNENEALKLETAISKVLVVLGRYPGHELINSGAIDTLVNLKTVVSDTLDNS